MTNVIVADLKRKSRGAKGNTSVRTKRMRMFDGKVASVLSLDANSPTFIDDLTTVFEKNVSKARLENLKLFGSPNGTRARK